MTETPFYSSGLTFSCRRCSACCRHDAGFVFLSENDIEKLSIDLRIKRNELIAVYCRWVTDFHGEEVLSLKEKTNNDCIFWDEGCIVYNSRPFQCRSFPFWESVLSSKDSWNITASSCPGMNSGKNYTVKEINDYLRLRALQPVKKFIE